MQVIGDGNMIFRSQDWNRRQEAVSSFLFPISPSDRDNIVKTADHLNKKVKRGAIEFDVGASCRRRWFRPRQCDSASFLQHLFTLALPKHKFSYAVDVEEDVIDDVQVRAPPRTKKQFEKKCFEIICLKMFSTSVLMISHSIYLR